MESRGIRNNNPLNIRLSSDKWQGQVLPQRGSGEGAFCQFYSMEYGWRAAFVILCRTYYGKYGLKTIRGIVSRWAPPKENNTEAYIRRVLELMGRDRGQTRLAPPHTKPGRLQLALLVAAMTCVETGCPLDAVPLDNLNAGFVLAGMGDPSLKVGA